MLESSCTSVPAPGICLVDTFRTAELFVTERVSKVTQSQCGSLVLFHMLFAYECDDNYDEMELCMQVSVHACVGWGWVLLSSYKWLYVL